jgi:hypothetical protein
MSLNVSVSCSFLYDMFERDGLSRMRQLHRIAEAMKNDSGQAWTTSYSNADARRVTISNVLTEFHRDLANAIESHAPELLDELVESLNSLGRNDYREPSFVADREHVVNLFGHHRFQTHGRVLSQARPKDVFLVDFSYAVSVYVFFRGSDAGFNTSLFIDNPSFLDSLAGNLPGFGLDKIAVNLCDTISLALDQAHGVANAISTSSSDRNKFIPFSFDFTDRSTLEVKIVARGLRGYRSLRKTHATVPVVGSNAVLRQAAIRHSHASTLVSRCFPKGCWRHLSAHSQNVIVEVATILVSSWISALSPSVPSREEMDQLVKMGAIAHGDCPIDGLIEQHKSTLDKLGIYEVVRDRHNSDNYLDRLQNLEWAWDWTWAFGELREALFNEDVRRSSWVSEQFKVEALHKQLLSVLETEVISVLRASMVAGNWEPASGKSHQAASLWKDSFKAQETSVKPLVSWPDREASLAVDATWLLHASEKQDSICLSDLLASTLQAFTQMAACGGVTLTLNPTSPQDHFISLDQISQNSDCSRSMTLCLGRLSIGLRNFVEHGVGEVCDRGILVRNDEFWETPRAYTTIKKPTSVNCPLRVWIKKTATDLSYPDASKLPAKVPVSANQLLLTHDSLWKTLVMISLLLQGAKSHLRLE